MRDITGDKMITDGHRTGSPPPIARSSAQAPRCPSMAASHREIGRLEAIPGSPTHMTPNSTRRALNSATFPRAKGATLLGVAAANCRTSRSSLANIVDKADKVQRTPQQATHR